MERGFGPGRAGSLRFGELCKTEVFLEAVSRLRSLDLTKVADPRPREGFVSAGAAEQGKSPWLHTLLGAELDMWECCQSAKDLQSPLRDLVKISDSVQAVVDVIVDLGTEIPSKRRLAMLEFRRIAGLLQPLSKEMRDSVAMPAHIKKIAGGLHVALIAACSEALGWRDASLALDMLLGMPVLDCPDSGCHRIKDQPPLEVVSEERNLKYNRKTLRQVRRMGKRCADDDAARLQSLAVWSKTVEEEGAGFVFRISERELNDKYGHGKWRSMLRFGVFQDGKWRCCDNAAASGHNDASHLRETIHCVDCAFPAAVGVAFARKGVFDCKLSCDDINAAYRKVGNGEPNFTIFVVWNPVACEHVFFEVPGFNFGLKAAVVGFNRFPEFCVEVSRRLFAVACAHFFDDYAVVDPKLGDGTAKEALWCVHEVLDFPLSVPKSVKLKYENAFLGVISDLAPLRWRVPEVRVRVKPGRVSRLKATLAGVLARRILSPADAARLRGKLYFLTTTSFGRVGRAPLQALVDRQYYDRSGSDVLAGSRLERALRFFLALLDHIKPRSVPAAPDSRGALLVWTDAMFEPAKEGGEYVETWITPPDGGDPELFYLGEAWIAFVVFDPVTGLWSEGATSVGIETIRHFVPGKKTYIGQLEALAAAAVYFNLPDDALRGREVIHWIDNQSALSGFVKGYSGQEDTSMVLNAFSFKVAELGFRVWWEFVPSAQNVADVPSRSRVRPDILDALGCRNHGFIIPEFATWEAQLHLL